MSSMAALPSPKLLFDWPGGQHVQLLLPTMIVFAALAHLGALLLFSLVYPEPSAGLLRPGEVYLLGREDISGGTVDRSWIVSTDPAIFSPTTPDRHLGNLLQQQEYEPGFDQVTPDLLPWEETPYPALPPIELPVRPLRIEWQGSREEGGAEKRVAAAKTRLHALGAFEEVSWPEGLEWGPVVGSAPPTNAWFLLAIDPQGTARHIFLERSSGYSLLDDQAEYQLKHLSFPPDTNASGLRWVRFSVLWGADVFRPANQSPSS